MKRKLKVFKNRDSEFMHEVTYEYVLLCMCIRSKNVCAIGIKYIRICIHVHAVCIRTYKCVYAVEL